MSQNLQKPKPIVTWYGGKARMAKIIAAKLPPHRIYVEPYGGACGVLMAKEPSHVEVYNDLHDGIVTLFRVVRDPLMCRQLAGLIELTPYARSEWKNCNATWEGETDLVEKARKVYTALSQNFVGVTKNGSWSFGGPRHDTNVALTFYRSLENLPLVMARLRGVLVECKPALDICKQWDDENTFIYLDPPYVPSTRNRNPREYKHEMTESDHVELLEWAKTARSKIFISGYKSELYDNALLPAGWVREEYEAIASSSLESTKNGLKGGRSTHAKRTECIWINPPAQQKTLWHLSGEEGKSHE